jgi:hypothetical protein
MEYTQYLRTNLSEDHPAYHYIMNPESDQAWKFVYWAYGGSVLGWAVYLVGTDSYFTKHIQSHAVPTQNAKHFASLTGFIKTLPFVETGRVVIFLSNANMTGAIHRDLAPSADVAPDEFIWMRTRTNKGFFVQDSESNEKYYVNSYAAWFNTTDYHGTDAAETASFSIRVDGVFTDEFRAKINEPA